MIDDGYVLITIIITIIIVTIIIISIVIIVIILTNMYVRDHFNIASAEVCPFRASQSDT